MAREEADGISSEVDLRECIEEAADSVRDRAQAKGLTLAGRCRRAGDPAGAAARFARGAVQSAGERGELYRARLGDAEQPAAARVEITDTGPGMARDRIPDLFRRFHRGDARGGDGFGLGLAIVKRICEQAGWDIAVESREEGGTRVTLSLLSAG
jgi:signal transduction histidine kinase